MSLGDLPVIARFEGPIFGVILRYRKRPHSSDEWVVHNYTTQRGVDIGGYPDGYHHGGYHFNREAGWEDFKKRMDRALAYAPFASDQAELERKEAELAATKKWIIMKSSRVHMPSEYTEDWAYRGGTCQKAGVEPGRVYDDPETAEDDARQLARHNGVGFVVLELATPAG